MNPHQKNKVDVNVRKRHMNGKQDDPLTQQQALSPDEQRLFRMYGKLPDKKNLLQHKLKVSRPNLHSFHLSFVLPVLTQDPKPSRAKNANTSTAATTQ